MRRISILLVLVLLGIIFEGCGGGSKETADQPESVKTGAAQQASTPASITELSLLAGSNASWPYNKNWWIWKALKDATGVSLNVAAVDDANWDEKLNITMASGELPDMIYMYDTNAKSFGKQGALLDFSTYLDQMPNYKKWSQENPEIFINSHDAEGGLYIAEETGLGDSNRMGWMFREDIFAKNRIRIPANSDEFYQVLVQLKKLYPDSYPLAFRMNRIGYSAPQWGASPNTLQQWNNDFYSFYPDPDTKKIKFGPVESNYKDMLMFYNKLYMEKLIPPDWLTMDTKAWVDLISNNKSFVTIDYLVRIDFFNTQIKPQNSEFNLKYMPPFKGMPNGQKKFAYTAFSGDGYTVSAAGKNIDAALKYINYLYSPEGVELTSWGKEGETYKVENGEKKFIDCKDSSEMRIKYGLSTNGSNLLYDFNATLTLCTPELKEAYSRSMDYDDRVPIVLDLNRDENAKITNICDQLFKYEQEEYAKFIMGKRSFKEWDKYVDELKAIGLEQAISTYQGVYDRVSARGK